MLRLSGSPAVCLPPARRGLRRPQRREQPRLRLRPLGPAADVARTRPLQAALERPAAPDHGPPHARRAHRNPRLRAVSVGAEPDRHSGCAAARAEGRDPRGLGRRRPPRGRRGHRPPARAARHGVLPRREPRRRAPIHACAGVRGRRSRPRLGPPRPAWAPALRRLPDRLLARQLRHVQPGTFDGGRPRPERDPHRDAGQRRNARLRTVSARSAGRRRPAPDVRPEHRAARERALARRFRRQRGARGSNHALGLG